MTEMYKRYIKYKIKYLHLVNNINGGEGTPIKRNYSFSETPEYPISSSKKIDINSYTDNEDKELFPINPYEIGTPFKSVSFSKNPITPSKERTRVYAKTPDKIPKKMEMPIITPSKDVNKNELIEILNSDEIQMICKNRNFKCIFKDKRKKGDGCVLELWTRPLHSDIYYNVGHITVHKGVSRSSAKSFHYKSDDFSNDSINFNLIITATQDRFGKYLLFGDNNISGKSNEFFELIWIYNRLGFRDLGNRIQDVVKDIIEYLNTFPDEIFYDPL